MLFFLLSKNPHFQADSKNIIKLSVGVIQSKFSFLKQKTPETLPFFQYKKKTHLQQGSKNIIQFTAYVTQTETSKNLFL